LLDDAVRTAGALGAADVDVSFHVWPNAPHAFHVLGTTMPAASTAIDEIGAFLAARIPKA
jgi:acetyl esterase/lipase